MSNSTIDAMGKLVIAKPPRVCVGKSSWRGAVNTSPGRIHESAPVWRPGRGSNSVEPQTGSRMAGCARVGCSQCIPSIRISLIRPRRKSPMLSRSFRRYSRIYTIQPTSLALSLASLQAFARNSDTVMAMRRSSVSGMALASNWGEFSGL